MRDICSISQVVCFAWEAFTCQKPLQREPEKLGVTMFRGELTPGSRLMVHAATLLTAVCVISTVGSYSQQGKNPKQSAGNCYREFLP